MTIPTLKVYDPAWIVNSAGVKLVYINKTATKNSLLSSFIHFLLHGRTLDQSKPYSSLVNYLT